MAQPVEKNASKQTDSGMTKLEKYSFILSLLKWFFGFTATVIVTIVIDKGFKERSAGIQEMEAFDKYVDIILKADNIQDRWKLSEFFSTVTPTDRLRERWISYKKLIEPDFIKFQKLKQEEFELKEQINENKSIDKIKKLNKVQKQLEPFEEKLISPNYPVKKIEISTDIPNRGLEPKLRKFLGQLKEDALTDKKYKLDYLFDMAFKIDHEAVDEVIQEIGGNPFQTIHAGRDNNYKEKILSNNYGINSKFDYNKKILPKFQVIFTDLKADFSLIEDGKTESISEPVENIDWIKVKSFIRAYFINRLEKLK